MDMPHWRANFPALAQSFQVRRLTAKAIHWRTKWTNP